MIAAFLLFAAIVTDRNDVFASVPPLYTFGEDSGGISSSYIPYGTFTEGVSDAPEYLRITTNLIGAVVSCFDGYRERSQVPFGLHDMTNKFAIGAGGDLWTNDTIRVLDHLNDLLRSFTTGQPGGALVSNFWTYAHAKELGAMTLEESLARTATNTNVPSPKCYRQGAAADYGGDYLDNLSNGGLPPIPTAHADSFDFLAQGTAWRGVFPVYGNCTNDNHFFQGIDGIPNHYDRDVLYEFLARIGNAGADYNAAVADLEQYLDVNPLTNTVEDVLKIDPGFIYEWPPVETGKYWTVSGPLGSFKLDTFYEGPSEGGFFYDNTYTYQTDGHYVEIMFAENTWTLFIFNAETQEQEFEQSVSGSADETSLAIGEYSADFTRLMQDRDDFTHWRNMTTRLDWKRLGIICQLERHMETRFINKDPDDIPLLKISHYQRNNYTGLVENAALAIDFDDYETVVDLGGYPKIYTFDASWTGAWATASRALSVSEDTATTNAAGRSYATARAISYPFNTDAGYVKTWHNIGIREQEFYSELLNSFPAKPQGVPAGTYNYILPIQLILGVNVDHVTITLFADELDLITGATTNSYPAARPIYDYYFNDEETIPAYEDQSASEVNMVHFTMTDRGTADAIFTPSPTDEDLALDDDPLWAVGYIQTKEYPTLDLVLCATNDPTASLVESPSDWMIWDELLLRDTAYSRLFGLNPHCARGASPASSRTERKYNMAEAVSLVNNTFANAVHVPVQVLARNLAAITGQAMQQLWQNMRATKGLRAKVSVERKSRLVLEGVVEWDANGDISNLSIANAKLVDDDTGSIEPARYRQWLPDPVQPHVLTLTDCIKFAEWSLVPSGPAYSTGGTNTACRADCYQSSVEKTRYKFRNLHKQTQAPPP